MSTKNQNSGPNNPKTGFGKWMVYTVIPNYSNNVQGVVYVGAAILIIIVGLRGLGSVAGDIPIVPGFLINEHDNKVDVNYVMFALFLEFFLLLILSTVTFFTPEDSHGHAPAAQSPVSSAGGKLDLSTLKQELSQFRNVAEEEIRAVDAYVDRMGKLSQQMNAMSKQYAQTLSEMNQHFKADTLKGVAEQEIKNVEGFVTKIGALTQNIVNIKKEYLQALTEIKQSIKA